MVPLNIGDRQLLQQAKEDGVLKRDYIAAVLDPEFDDLELEDPNDDPDDPNEVG